MRETLYILLIFLGVFTSCKKDNIEEKVDEVIVEKEPLKGSRIAWDYSSLQKLVPLSGNSINYSSYARMIELADGDFICVYEADGNINIIRSTDKAKTWSQPMRIISFSNNRFMTVPEIIQLANGNIIISYNPRPAEPFSIDRPFAIHTKTSIDNGANWGKENIVYEGGITFETGCWEPNIIQLPTGELQLYFANETDYTSHEQNISMFRSSNNGETWGEREIVSFSSGSRDGMPVALHLKESDEIIMAIEDNFQNNFKPAIIRTNNNWKNATVGRNTPDRAYALNHDQRTVAYQGAPYLRRMPSGNVVPIFVGHKGETNIGVKLSYDETNLHIKGVVTDKAVFSKDGVTFSIDPKNISSEAPAKGIYSLTVTSDGAIISKEGFNQNWEKINFAPQNLNVNITAEGYKIDLTLSWDSIGGKPNTGERIGFSVALAEYNTPSRITYSEQLNMSDWDKPYTWLNIKL